MEFTFETEYHQKAITVMAETLRKTIRKKHNRRSRIFGWIVVVLALLLLLPIGKENDTISVSAVVTGLAAIVMVVVLLFEDKINGYVARKRMIAGVDRTTSVFNDDKYVSFTSIGNTEWSYKHIDTLAETDDYFVFIFDKSHAQLYDKHHLTGGTVDEFREFIKAKTEKELIDLRK